MDRPLLLPIPKRHEAAEGVCPIAAGIAVELRVNDARIEQAVSRWRGTLPRSDSVSVILVVGVDAGRVGHPQGYRLEVCPDRIELVGGSAAGCYHGLQTLMQLVGGFAADRQQKAVQSVEVRCCRVEDEPGFCTRGLLHDVTRGKVPTLATLKLLVDRIASLKVNQLQLYIEHAFVFDFDADICDAERGLTPAEVRELDTYCRERFIELVPAVATLGHMGRILSLPRYRHLAEIEAATTWENMSWPQRARGLTLDVCNPEARRLVERIWTDILAAFSSPVVNICGDEPWDLGRGRNASRIGPDGRGEAYMEHIRRTHEFCAARGRRTQFWSDVVTHYPNLFDCVPRDSAVLHWGYDDRADYEGAGKFVAAGLETFVCPGTSGWKRIINAMGPAERNIGRFASAGRQHGATGLLNTDWGDHGHFNALACSWHGIALGAALGWNADQLIGPDFDARFVRHMLGVDDVSLVSALRQTSAWAESAETWRFLWQTANDIQDDPALPGRDTAEEAKRAACHAYDCCTRVLFGAPGGELDQRELLSACAFTELLADKVMALHRAATPGGSGRPLPLPSDWRGRLAHETERYADTWRLRNKPSGLADILAAMERVQNDYLPGPV